MTYFCGRLKLDKHSFIIGAGRVPEVDHAVTEMGRWVRSKLGLEQLPDPNSNDL
jgi:hypothetical protein